MVQAWNSNSLGDDDNDETDESDDAGGIVGLRDKFNLAKNTFFQVKTGHKVAKLATQC